MGQERKWPALIVTGIFVAAALVAIVKFVGPPVEGLFSNGGDSVRLRVDPQIVDREPERGLINLRSEPTPATAPQVDLYVRNEGGSPVSLGRVEIRIERAIQLSSCIPPQGAGPGLPPLERPLYVNLPLLPLPGERDIVRNLDETVEAGGAVPVHLIFRSLEEEQLDEVYLLRVTLDPDGGAPLGLGRFLLSLPGAINRTGAWLPEEAASLNDLRSFHQRLISTWCYRRNLAIVGELTQMGGRRSAPMKVLSAVRPAPNWAVFADPLPAREAAVRLLKDAPPESRAPTLAVFAAERTGDPRFVAAIRRRAAKAELREARQDIEGEDGIAKAGLIELREALAIESAAAGRRLLPRAEAKLRQAEHAAGELAY